MSNSMPGTAPTHQTYSELQQAYDHFNEALFDGKLPHCLLTLQREKRTVGYFSAARFASLEGATTDEIEPPRDSWRLFGLSQAAIVVA